MFSAIKAESQGSRTRIIGILKHREHDNFALKFGRRESKPYSPTQQEVPFSAKNLQESDGEDSGRRIFCHALRRLYLRLCLKHLRSAWNLHTRKRWITAPDLKCTKQPLNTSIALSWATVTRAESSALPENIWATTVNNKFTDQPEWAPWESTSPQGSSQVFLWSVPSSRPFGRNPASSPFNLGLQRSKQAASVKATGARDAGRQCVALVVASPPSLYSQRLFIVAWRLAVDTLAWQLPVWRSQRAGASIGSRKDMFLDRLPGAMMLESGKIRYNDNRLLLCWTSYESFNQGSPKVQDAWAAPHGSLYFRDIGAWSGGHLVLTD